MYPYPDNTLLLRSLADPRPSTIAGRGFPIDPTLLSPQEQKEDHELMIGETGCPPRKKTGEFLVRLHSR
jgi:hypothetical protein